MLDTAVDSWNLDYSGDETYDIADTTGTYGVVYVKSGPDYEDGYLSRGDVVRVQFNVSSAVQENQKVRLKIIPRTGTTTIIEFTTPDVMTDNRISLWP